MMVILEVSSVSTFGEMRLLTQHNLAKQHSINIFCSQSICLPLFSFNNFSLSTLTKDINHK